jgi:RNA polymerase sigma factor (sigma-70 family)
MQVPDDGQPPPATDPSPGAEAACAPFPWAEAIRIANGLSRRFVKCRGTRSQVAEDIAQESVARLSRNLERIEGDWQPYLFTIVQNVSRTYLKRDSARRRALPPQREDGDDPSDEHPGPDVQAFVNECDAALPALMDQLDERFGRRTRAVVDLRSRGVPWAEIADIVSLCERTCSNRLNEAMAWLGKCLSLEVPRRGRHE